MSDRTDRPAPEDLPALAPSRRDGPGQLGGHQDEDGPVAGRWNHRRFVIKIHLGDHIGVVGWRRRGSQGQPGSPRSLQRATTMMSATARAAKKARVQEPQRAV